MDEGITTQQAAEILGVARYTINRWVKEGLLSAETIPFRGPYHFQYQLKRSTIEKIAATILPMKERISEEQDYQPYLIRLMRLTKED